MKIDIIKDLRELVGKAEASLPTKVKNGYEEEVVNLLLNHRDLCARAALALLTRSNWDADKKRGKDGIRRNETNVVSVSPQDKDKKMEGFIKTHTEEFQQQVAANTSSVESYMLAARMTDGANIALSGGDAGGLGIIAGVSYKLALNTLMEATDTPKEVAEILLRAKIDDVEQQMEDKGIDKDSFSRAMKNMKTRSMH